MIITALEPIVLTPEQDGAVTAVVDWFMAEEGQTTFKLHGYAGTGKTTVLREAVRRIEELSPDVRLHFAAFTGKASQVMRSKGLDGATTLHTNGLIWEARTSKRTGSTYYHPLTKGLAGLDSLDLLIVDECSMLSNELLVRMVYHPDPDNLFPKQGYSVGPKRPIRILAVGDPAQLWPIPKPGHAPEPSRWAREGEHHARLERVHRSAEGSLVLEAAAAVRGPERRDFARMWELIGMGSAPSIDRFLEADQVIAYTNVTRWYLVDLLRRIKGRPEGVPVKGDKLVLLKNTAGVGVNGEQFEVEWAISGTVEDSKAGQVNYFTIGTTEGRTLCVPACMFVDLDGEEAGRRLCGKAVDEAFVPVTFADAITCHKAQGSEWESVIVVDEGFMAGQSEGWHYTAITRARSKVGVVSVKHLPTGYTPEQVVAIREAWRSAVWGDETLSHTVKVTALAIEEALPVAALRAGCHTAGVAEQIDRSPRTVETHMTTLRKAGYLRGNGGLTSLKLP